MKLQEDVVLFKDKVFKNVPYLRYTIITLYSSLNNCIDIFRL